jgi:hypothetical protein
LSGVVVAERVGTVDIDRMARGATNGTAAEENTVVPFVALDRQHQWLGHQLASTFDHPLARTKEH